MFHLMTHAFFKALLFMAAGVVIHALAAEQDIRKMGGLGALLPWTYRYFLIGALALAAIPPFAGFFSKDAILASAAGQGTLGWILWGIGALGAFLTALYTFRLVFIVFCGKPSEFVERAPAQGALRGAALDDVAGRACSPCSRSSAASSRSRAAGPAWTTWLEPVAESIEEVEGAHGVVLGALRARARAPRHRARLACSTAAPSDRPARIRAPAPLGAADARAQALLRRGATTPRSTSRPSRVSLALARYVERPIFLLPLGELGFEVRVLAGRVAAAQTGMVRTYALAVAAGLAVLARRLHLGAVS